jgi:cytochrome c oxidase subunit 2
MNRPSSSPGINILPLIIIAIVVIGGGILISFMTPMFFPPQGSAQAAQIDTLFQVMLAIGAALFLLVQFLIFYSAIRFRVTDENDKSDGPPIHGHNGLEIFWTAVPALVVVILVIYSYSVFQSLQAPVDNEYTVEVIGQRFAWTFTYTAADDVINPRTGAPVEFNDTNLRTYVNQNLHLSMTTPDVNHAFWVPEMRLKQDLLTGRTTELRFTPIMVAGRSPVDNQYYAELGFPLRCAELCGDGHGNMGLISHVIVYETQAEYQAWFDARVFQELNPPADPVPRGESLLVGATYPCSGCHTLTTMGWTGVTGPNLDGIGDRATRRVSGETASSYLVNSLRHPQRFIVPGYSSALMPQFHEDDSVLNNYMPDEDAVAIAAYLCTQTDTGESACTTEELEAAATEEVTEPGTASQ